MSFVHGTNTDVLLDEYDLTGYANQASVTNELQTVDVTVFGNADHAFLGGLVSGTASVSGLFDAAGSDTIAAAAYGSGSVLSIAWPGFGTIGNRSALLNCRSVEYAPRATVDDAVRFTLNAQGNGAVRIGIVLKDLAAETSTGNFSSVDNGAASSLGAVGNLHVTAFSGTNATIKITDSTNDSTFADLITFTTVTGVTSEHKTVTGTVNRYARVELSGSFTSITFAVTFGRNNN